MNMKKIIKKYQLSTTDDEENYETDYPIDPDKPPPSSAAQIDIALPSSISALPIVATKAQFSRC